MRENNVTPWKSALLFCCMALLSACAEPLSQEAPATSEGTRESAVLSRKPELSPADPETDGAQKMGFHRMAALVNGVPVTDISGAYHSEQRWTLTLPSGVARLVITTAYGPGDADLYIRRGAEPTTSVYDCRGFSGSNTENCTFDGPEGGTWYVMVHGYREFSGVTLLASYTMVGSLSSWDANIEVMSPACSVVRFVDIPASGFQGLPGARLDYALPDGGGGFINGSLPITADMSSLVIYNTLPNFFFEEPTYEDFGITFAGGAPPSCTSGLSIRSSPLPAPGWPLRATTRVESGEPWGTLSPGSGEFPKYHGVSSAPQQVTAASILSYKHPCKTTVQFKVN